MKTVDRAMAASKNLVRFATGTVVMRYLSLRYRDVLRELRPLATRMEQEISPKRKGARETLNVFALSDAGLLLNGAPIENEAGAPCPALRAALQRTGITRFELDVLLEEGQVAEALLLLLHAHRFLPSATAPTKEYDGWGARGIAGQMQTRSGFHRFCFVLRVEREAAVFRAAYSYCELPLSAYIQRFVQTRRYGDHRALFRAAPRVAFVSFLLVTMPALLYVWFPGVAIALYCFLGVLAALIAGVVLYTLGSVQYTREHHDTMMKAYVQDIEKLSRFPEANPNVVMELSAEGEALYINPAGQRLIAELKLEEDALEQVLSPEYRNLIRASLDAPGQVFRHESSTHARTFNGQYVSFMRGNTVILAASEVSYLKHIEAELREAHALAEDQRNAISEAYRLLDAEFEVIGNIQRSLLPSTTPRVPGLEITAHYETCQRAGGDYYDFFPLRNGNLGILVADVSGHGSPAAVLMAITHTIAHILHEQSMEIAPHEVIDYINRNLVRHYQHRGDFVTALYGIYDPTQATFCYSSAGHNPPVYRARCADTPHMLGKQCGIPLGILEDTEFESTELSLPEGSLILLYTDGITEAMDRDQRLFGEERMIAAACGAEGSAAHRLECLLVALNAHSAEEALSDDRTVVLLQRTSVDEGEA